MRLTSRDQSQTPSQVGGCGHRRPKGHTSLVDPRPSEVFIPRTVRPAKEPVSDYTFGTDALLNSLSPHRLSAKAITHSIARRYPRLDRQILPNKSAKVYAHPSLRFGEQHYSAKADHFNGDAPIECRRVNAQGVETTLREALRDVFKRAGAPFELSALEASNYLKIEYPGINPKVPLKWDRWSEFTVYAGEARRMFIRLNVEA